MHFSKKLWPWFDEYFNSLRGTCPEGKETLGYALP